VGTRNDGLQLTDSYPTGTTTISWLATDVNGNTASTTQIITVTDDTPPSLTAPPAVATTTGAGAAVCGKLISDATLGTATASDNCSVTVLRSGIPAGNIFPVGTTTLTYTATDP